MAHGTCDAMEIALVLITAGLSFAPANTEAPDAGERVSVVGVGASADSPAPEPASDPLTAPAPEQSDAADPPAAERSRPPRTWQAQLFIDLAYGFNSNFPDNHVYRGMYTNPRTNELSVSNVGAFVKHPTNEREPWQFELGLQTSTLGPRASTWPPPTGWSIGTPRWPGTMMTTLAWPPSGFFYRREFGSDDAIGLAREQHTVFLSLTA